MRVYQTPKQALQQHLNFEPDMKGAAESDSGLGADGVGAILEGEHSPSVAEMTGLAEVFKGSTAGDFGYRGIVTVDRSAKPEGSHTRFVASTADPDRAGDIVDQSSWELDLFRKNPVIPWGHHYFIRPVGRADKVWTQAVTKDADADDHQLLTDVTWDMEGEFSGEVGRQFQQGFLHAGSVGFIPGKRESRFDLEEDHPRFGKTGEVLTGNELLEFSACTVPMNGRAVAQRSVGMGAAVQAFGAEFQAAMFKTEILKAIGDAKFITECRELWAKGLVKAPGSENGDPQDPSDASGKSDWWASLK